MNSPGEVCACGREAVLLGRCTVCFGELTLNSQAGARRPDDATRFRAGQQYGGRRFTLVEPLGEGGMGTVWLAEDEQLSADGAPEQVALKFILGDGQPDAELVGLLRKEVRAALRLSHANIVRVHSWHEHPGEPVFYSMEFVPGLDLKRLLAAQAAGRFTCQELDPLLFQLVEALNYAHEQVGLVHRDLKPANLLVSPEGRLKLADFGLARPDVAEDRFATTAGGTLVYASPAQRRGAAPTVADDIYSLGAVLYHLLTDQVPFSLEDLTGDDLPPPPVHPWRLLNRKAAIRRDITPEAAATILRCLSDDPGERPADVRTFWQWWKTGPPPEEEHPASETWVRAAQGVLSGVGLLLLLAVALALAWKSGLDGFLEKRLPKVAAAGRQLERKLTGFPVVATTKPEARLPDGGITNATGGGHQPEPPITNGASLALHLVGMERGSVRVEIFRGARSGEPEDREGKPTRVQTLEPGHELVVTNLESGNYRLEAGTGAKKTAATWVQQAVSLTGGSNSVAVDLRPGGLHLFLSDPAPFELSDAWGNVVWSIRTNEFALFHSPPVATSPWWAARLARLKLLGGRYRLRLDAETTNSLHLEPKEASLVVLAGQSRTNNVTLEPWRTPRIRSDWTNSLAMHLLPAVAGAPFLASRTETTFGQFASFADATQLPAAAIESITAQGATNVGRTWRDAFPKQSPDHPVVGVSWDEATAFCEWLTRRERASNQLGARQRYALPTAAQWSAIVGTNSYPWAGSFPPRAGQGNYAGQELKDSDWPTTWNLLLLESYDPTSRRTVPVGRSAGGDAFADLGGNVAEWCDTWYRTALNDFSRWKVRSRRLADDHGGEFYRVVRGGSWFDQDPDLLRSATHWAERPETRNDRTGFRVVLVEDN